jgi:hypothetical protein
MIASNAAVVELESAFIRCTTPTPAPCLAAILWMPYLPCCKALAMAALILAATRGHPIGLPLLVPFSRARATSAMMRSFRIERSSSANTPAICIFGRLVGHLGAPLTLGIWGSEVRILSGAPAIGEPFQADLVIAAG